MRRVRSGGGGRRLAGSGDKPRWRVFVSHTSELHDFPKGTSYVAAAERAIIATGHIPVDMTDFPVSYTELEFDTATDGGLDRPRWGPGRWR